MMDAVNLPSTDERAAWQAKHNLALDAEGYFDALPEGKTPASEDELLANIKANALRHEIPNLLGNLYKKATMIFVAGGPSAGDYLDDIRTKSLDASYDVFCSNGTAAWLLKRGITPKYQVIIDPKPSKIDDVAHGNEAVVYLIGLQCSPALFDVLAGKQVRKFLAASAKIEWEAARMACVPGNEQLIVIGGGTMMGTRAMTLANALGYRRLEYYGFDGSVRMHDGKVQSYSYHKPRTEAITEIETEDGRTFYATLTFSRQAHEIEMFRLRMPWLEIVIHGDGFLAHTLALQKAKECPPQSNRISDAYLAMQREMHANPNYGVNHSNLAGPIYLLSAQISKKRGACDVLDYGCGKSALEASITRAFAPAEGVRFFGYDPAVHGKDAEPYPANLVVCADVMEHVEGECVNAVLDHIAKLAKDAVYFSIALNPAAKTLPDGRNAHITLLDDETWIGKLKVRWILTETAIRGGNLIAIGQPLPKGAE